MSRVSEQPQLIERPPEGNERKKVFWGLAIVIPVVIVAGALTLARMEQLKQLSQPSANGPIINSINAVGRLETILGISNSIFRHFLKIVFIIPTF